MLQHLVDILKHVFLMVLAVFIRLRCLSLLGQLQLVVNFWSQMVIFKSENFKLLFYTGILYKFVLGLGLFPNHIPNPEDKTAMKAITKAVLDNKADLGIIFDTDVDR